MFAYCGAVHVRGSFDGPATPLAEATFVVVDLETTGTSAELCDITEVGALKLRGGECASTLHTWVGDGRHDGVGIESVMPALLEFVGGAVLVGHNVAFDLRFLQAGASRLGYPPLANAVVDTYALARRLVRADVEDCRLSTLARHFRVGVVPNHRALVDASATAEVFHAMLELAAGFGVVDLDDLLAFPVTGAHPQAAKLRLVASLPRAPGSFVFRDRDGRVLYVGTAASDMRAQVRSYFAGVDRRKMGPVLRRVHAIDHVPVLGDLRAAQVTAVSAAGAT